MEILAGIGLALVFVYAAGQIRAGQMTVGGLLSFLAAILMLYKPLKDVTKTNIVLQVALAAADRLFDVIDGKNDIVERPGAATPASLRSACSAGRTSTSRYAAEQCPAGREPDDRAAERPWRSWARRAPARPRS